MGAIIPQAQCLLGRNSRFDLILQAHLDDERGNGANGRSQSLHPARNLLSFLHRRVGVASAKESFDDVLRTSLTHI